MEEPILVMKGIEKQFPGVLALNNAHLNVRRGEVMALIGENGAGKSTLMKILTGVYARDKGEVIYRGKPVEYMNTRQSMNDGIAIIHQELTLIPQMTVYENIFLGREAKTKMHSIDRKFMIDKSNELLGMLNVGLDPNSKVGTLSIAQQQMVEIAKVLLYDTQLIIMDEPTDALPDDEVDSLFKVLKELKKQNKAIVYITHRLKEIFQICDRVTVMRDGAFISESKVSDVTNDSLVEMMVGRTLRDQFPHIEISQGDKVLEVAQVSNQYVHDVSFDVHAGEILGIVGLVGAGRTELAKTIYGCFSHTKGTVRVNGKPVEPGSIKKAIHSGIYYMTEDRKQNGLVMLLDVRMNMTLSSLRNITKLGLVNTRKEKQLAEEYKDRTSVKTPSIYQKVRNLSGGNQQKVILAKALLTQPDVLILDEPTRGIDVGAKKEIYSLINELKAKEKAIIIISSEMPEILGMSDRILVMNEGRVKGELLRENATQEKIMKMILY
ncbi:MAG: sugar ABC transporter ATP-binding protein [Clostridia bacterium]